MPLTRATISSQSPSDPGHGRALQRPEQEGQTAGRVLDGVGVGNAADVTAAALRQQVPQRLVVHLSTRNA